MNRRQFLQSALTLPVVNPTLSGNGTRFAVIADLQMFKPETQQILALVAARPVEFVIVAGDVTDLYPEQSDIDANWTWTLQQLNTPRMPWYAVPGNHDLHRVIDGVVTRDSPATWNAWARYIGPFEFVKDTAHSRIVGVNCDAWDYDWITAQFAGWSGRRIVVSHYPLTGVIDWWLWPSAAQAAEQLAFLQSIGIDWFISAHRHQFIAARTGRLQHVVTPAVSYVYGPNQPDEAVNGVIPFSLPTRGWIEVIDGDSLTVELYRADGQQIWSYAPSMVYFPFAAH